MGSNIGTGEILVILIVGLLVVGPEKLPKLAKAFGKAFAGFKSYMNDVTADLKDATDLTEISGSLTDMQKDLQDTFSGATNDVRDAVKLKDGSAAKDGKDGKPPVKKAADKPAEASEDADVQTKAEAAEDANVQAKAEAVEDTDVQAEAEAAEDADVRNETTEADTQEESAPAGDTDANAPPAEQK